MRAFAVDRFRAPGAIVELPRPAIDDASILIRVKAAGVNPIDWKLADGGKPGLDVPFPFVLGQDCAGVVEAVGARITDFRPGDEVFGACWWRGTYAEFVSVAPRRAAMARKPGSINFAQAAAIPTPALAARAAVKALALRPKQTVLIIGATGGVGSYAVQLAALAGARVIATAAAQDSPYVMELGAAETIDHRTHNVTATVQSRHPAGIDAAIDVISNREALQTVVPLLRSGGRLASTTHAADIESLAAQGIGAVNVDVLDATDGLEEIATLVAQGRIRVPATRIFPFDAAANAIAQSRSGRTRGKIVLSVSS